VVELELTIVGNCVVVLVELVVTVVDVMLVNVVVLVVGVRTVTTTCLTSWPTGVAVTRKPRTCKTVLTN